MNNKIIILKDYRGFIRQDITSHSSINLDSLKEIFKKNKIDTEEYFYDELASGNKNITNSFIIYSSSQSPEYKSYIDDILYFLAKENCLIPRYEIFKAHENKGFQELLRRDLEIPVLDSYYFATVEDLSKYIDNINFPVVFKAIWGAGSSNVCLVKTKAQLINLIKRRFTSKGSIKFEIKKFLKKNFLKNRYNSSYYSESQYIGRFILQKYIPNLKDDWKVLIFGQKYYVLNRKTRDNDFRASGSGKLSFIEPPKGLLDYAKSIYMKLDTPFISLDLCYHGEKIYLIEFQGTHFGPYTLIKSPYYFKLNNEGDWEKVCQTSDLTEEYAKAILLYIKNKQ